MPVSAVPKSLVTPLDLGLRQPGHLGAVRQARAAAVQREQTVLDPHRRPVRLDDVTLSSGRTPTSRLVNGSMSGGCIRNWGPAEEYLAECRALLERRMTEINIKAAAEALEDVRIKGYIKGGEMKITPLKAITPEEAEAAAGRLYAVIPSARITSVLAHVNRWTGFADAFTRLVDAAGPLLAMYDVAATAQPAP